MIGDAIVYFATLVTMLSVIASGLNDHLVDATDMVEVNHMHSREGEPTFTQVIFWDWDQEDSKYHVRAWTMDEKVRFYRGSVVYFDSSLNATRVIRYRYFKESWTQNDPERADKEHVAETERIKLVQRVLKPVEPMILPEVDQ